MRRVAHPKATITALDHVQLAMPRGRESDARTFYVDILGFVEIAKPAHLAARGGLWLEVGTVKLHLGVEDAFTPARKAHPAFLVADLPQFSRRLAQAGVAVVSDEPLAGYDRVYVSDPFGNRVELMQLITSVSSTSRKA